ncbi:MAG: hypothetical protein IIC83_06350, partial [Chloroflexi bacterium]|nr:hypothetical protein [Chloroflexota bacterium]
MNGFEVIARILKTEGVELLFCFPSNSLIEAVAKEGIRPLAFRHERGAIMAADGYSRMHDGKKFGIVAMQHQAGAENSLGGVAQAFGDNIPMLLLPGGMRLDQINVRPNFYAVANYQNVTKQAESVFRVDQITTIMRRAFHAMRNGGPGPVMVEMHTDVCGQEVPEAAMDYSPPGIMRQQPSISDIKDAVKTLLSAKKPVIWSGGGVLMADATVELQELAELMEIPVYC